MTAMKSTLEPEDLAGAVRVLRERRRQVRDRPDPRDRRRPGDARLKKRTGVSERSHGRSATPVRVGSRTGVSGPPSVVSHASSVAWGGYGGEDLAVQDGEPAVGMGRPAAPRVGHVAEVGRSPTPSSTACVAIADSVMRSAQRSPHHARSSGVAKHHADAPGCTSVKPAACAHARRNRPASGSPLVGARDGAVQRRATRRARGRPGYQVNAA